MDREDYMRCSMELNDHFEGRSQISGAACLFASTAIKELLDRAEEAEKRAKAAEALVMDSLGDTYDIDRLRELVEADRDGRCEIHVAKDGGTVYSIFAYVNGLHIRKSNGEPITKIVPCVVDDFTRATVDREFGKTVFRTREDAEQALREWENKKENQQMGMGHRI